MDICKPYNSWLPFQVEGWWLNIYQHTTAYNEKASEMALFLVTFLFFLPFQGHWKSCGIAGLFSFSLSSVAAFNIVPHQGD